MKTTAWLIVALMITGAFFIQGSRVIKIDDQKSVSTGGFQYPVAVKQIIDQKCYGCHSIKGRMAKAREALMWDSVPNYDKARLVAKLGDIVDVLDDGSMPPKEMVQRFPDAKLLPEENKILRNWADAKADSLMN